MKTPELAVRPGGPRRLNFWWPSDPPSDGAERVPHFCVAARASPIPPRPSRSSYCFSLSSLAPPQLVLSILLFSAVAVYSLLLPFVHTGLSVFAFPLLCLP